MGVFAVKAVCPNFILLLAIFAYNSINTERSNGNKTIQCSHHGQWQAGGSRAHGHQRACEIPCGIGEATASSAQADAHRKQAGHRPIQATPAGAKGGTARNEVAQHRCAAEPEQYGEGERGHQRPLPFYHPPTPRRPPRRKEGTGAHVGQRQGTEAVAAAPETHPAADRPQHQQREVARLRMADCNQKYHCVCVGITITVD